LIAFCKSCEYWLVPVKFVLPLELELEELELDAAVNPVFAVVAEVRELTLVPINDSRAGQDKSSYPAREGSCPGGGRAPAMSGFS
jgi:hypothetical protein